MARLTKPYAIRRTYKSGGRIQDLLRARQWIIDARNTSDETFRADCLAIARSLRDRRTHHVYIQRGRRFFYCQYCGCRMTTDQTVYSKTDKTTENPTEVLCRQCADDRNYPVFDYEARSTSTNFSRDYDNATYIQ